DHCQRYQGITRASSNKVKNAIATTEGLILTAEGKICDARFSKCCGGMTELFENCWEPVSHPYLQAFEDSQSEDVPDLTCEANADTWIRTSPKAFCNTTDKGILSQVLNNYDQETTDFYRWKVILKQEEISELIKRKSGIDFGSIKNLVPVERGTSGRLIKLRIEGTKKTMTIGKELEIRRYLSESHLYSSAFVIDKEGKTKGVPQAFILTGAGWGHGVGLCQIGAAMMGAIGYNYKQILSHYFRGTELEKRY
ncbi:MAG: SpoIID/LytB domain-containing protein, partial [Massilibacteroides sp.]|nr:SpoIID/LytB domain-containing protein [Massilibacteroides sp.]